MTGSHMRLRRIRMKDGPDISILRSRKAPDGGMGWRGKIVEHARMIAENDQSPMVGFFVIGLFQDGSYNSGFRVCSKTCPIPLTLMPSYIEEIVRREAVTSAQFHDEYERV